MLAQIEPTGIVTIAFWSAVTVISLTLVLLAIVLFMRAAQIVREARQARTLDRWRPILLDTLEEPPPNPPRAEEDDARTVLALWNYYRQFLRGGEEEGKLNRLARDSGMDRVARTLLDVRSVRVRRLAIETLGNLGDRAAFEDLVDVAYSDHAYLSLAAARAMIRIDTRRALPMIVELIGQRADWVPHSVVAMLSEAGADAVSDVLPLAVLSAGDDFKPLMILYLQAAHTGAAIPVIQRIIRETDDDQVITTCIYMIGKLADPRGLPTLRRYIDHDDWRIRLHCCSAMARLGTEEDVRRLVKRLSDRQYWVRYRAAQALASLPFLQADALHELQELVDDPYAVDILEQVIAEREAGERPDEAAEAAETGEMGAA